MKTKRKARPAPPPGEARAAFLRGFVGTALLSVLQNRAEGKAPLSGKTVLRHAVQGGSALSAGTIAAEAMLVRDYTLAFTATLAGAAGVWAAETLLRDGFAVAIEENMNVQEEA